MSRLMGWEKKGKDEWTNWTGKVYIGKIGKQYAVKRFVPYSGHPDRKRTQPILLSEKVKQKTKARKMAISWLRQNPHYRNYISNKEKERLDDKYRGGSGFRSLKWKY